MLRRTVFLLMVGLLSGCAGGLGQTYYVQFMSFSASPDPQGQATVESAAAFAKANPLMPVTIDGFHYGQYTNQVDSMAEERVRVVISQLVRAGVARARIQVLGKGISYAQGSPISPLPPNTVKIGIGL